VSGGVGTSELPDAVAAAITRRLEDAWTSFPARVESVSADGASVYAQPLVRWRHVDELGNDVLEALPVIPQVPVVRLSGGGFVVTCPVAEGDTVLIVVTDASIDRWLALGGVVDPGDYRRHYFGTGAIAIPGLRDFAHKLGAIPNDRIVIGEDGGLQSHFTSTEVKLGGAAATQAAAMKSDLDALHTALASWTPVAGDGGAALKAILTTLFGTGWPVCSMTVKVKP
jgi:hypothetical protein